MALRAAYRLLVSRLDDHPGVWLVGLAFGLVLGGGYALLFVLDGVLASPVAYAGFVLVVAPLFGAALWPYAAGDPPESVRELPRVAARGYPGLLVARLGYVALLGLLAGAVLAVPTVLGTLASLVNYLAGGGATTLGPEHARDLAALVLGLVALVGLVAARLLFGFVDVAALSAGPREAVPEAFETALGAPGRTAAVALALVPYRLGLPAVALFVSGMAAETRGVVDAFVASPRLAVLPSGAPSYATVPEPSLAPELLAVFVVADVVVTTLVWPVAFGFHVAAFETLREQRGDGAPGATAAPGDPAGQ
ncbi:hypothetical protein [Haloglomus litoreum]|uniref:hypothetical protein n=1 Tax=Haloglomus litoreum TaxID=3034026 RepID=UPI0023E874F2|nr:hypothetical protein [Haloglomus sp. DT116]